MFTTAGWWGQFWANFLSDVVVGALIVACLNYLVGTKLSAFELSQERKAEKRSDINKGTLYLDLLKREIEHLVSVLPRLRNIFTEYEWGREIRIATPYWDVLDRGGELPRLVNPSLLWLLTRFYGDLAYARRGRDLLIQSWLVPHPSSVPGISQKQNAFFKMAVSGLDGAMKIGQELVEQVDSEIEDLKKQLESIQ